MIAASTAASMNPASSGWKRICPRAMKTVSGSSRVRPCCWKYATPTSAVAMAPRTDRAIQPIPMRRAEVASRTDRMAMNRTMMCGWPK